MEENNAQAATPETAATEQKIQGRKLPFGKDVEVYRQFEYADVYIWCSKCGSDIRAGGTLENVQTALHIDAIGADSHSLMAMACPVCGNVIALHFKEALNPPSKEEKGVENNEEGKDNTSIDDAVEVN